VVGGQDQKLAAMATRPDSKSATLCLGTAGAMEFICNKPVFDDKMRIPLFSYLGKNSWTLETVVSTTGACYKWLKETLFQNLSYADMDSIAAKAKPCSNGLFFYPHFSGATSPHWQLDTKGFFYGFTLGTKTEDIIQSILEGVAYQIRTNLQICENLDRPKSSITVFGTGSSSVVWCQIFADVTNKKVVALFSPDAAGLGAAKLAFDLVEGKEAVYFDEEIFRDCRVYTPNLTNVAKYNEFYKEYIRIEEKML
jgi:xylulokinase